MIGQSIGNYRVTRLLGEGGMGMVYLAEHPALGRRAAVKVLHPDLVASEEMIQRLFNEARAANAIGHPGIVEVSDLGLLPSGTPYIVMEFLEGQSLGVLMSEGGRLSLPVALDIAGQAAGAVGAAHAKGIIHRDLKPDNLFLTPDAQWPGRERVKVLDFGIAKLARRPVMAADVRTRTGAILGTPRYMSPEQCRDSREVDHRTDIYSLGVILFEMLAGQPPFVSNSWGEMAHMHIGVKPPDLRELVPDLPPSIERAVARALEKEPGARFQSMAELRQALDGTAAIESPGPPVTLISEAASAAAPEPPSTLRFDAAGATRPIRRTTLAGAASEIQRSSSPDSPPGRRRAPLLVAGVLGVAIVVIGAVAALRQPRPEPAAQAPEAVHAQVAPRASAALSAPAAQPRAAVTPPAVAPVEPEAPGTLSVENPTRPDDPNMGERPRAAAKNPPRNPSAPAKPAPARHRPAEKPRSAPAAATPPEPLKI